MWHFRFIGFVAKISVLNSKLPMDGLFVGKKNEMFSGGGIPFFFFFLEKKNTQLNKALISNTGMGLVFLRVQHIIYSHLINIATP